MVDVTSASLVATRCCPGISPPETYWAYTASTFFTRHDQTMFADFMENAAIAPLPSFEEPRP